MQKKESPVRQMPALRSATLWLLVLAALMTVAPRQAQGREHAIPSTGFLNRQVKVQGKVYRFQVYVPDTYQYDDKEKWPIILFLHGRGERGSEGMWQTQVGLPTAVRDHPERWPFLIVMPQCPFRHFWTEPEMLQMAMATLNQTSREFHADSQRTYLVGLSMGGYGSWELVKSQPERWAAVTIAAGGVFWSYEPSRWKNEATLPGEYAEKLGATPIWLFHGTDDHTVIPKQSELMYNAIKARGGHVRLWEYIGYRHNSWDRAFNSPEVPKWLLSHHLGQEKDLPPFAEKIMVPVHPTVAKVPETLYDEYVGEYRDDGILMVSIYRQGDDLYQRNPQGEVALLLPETPTTFFFPYGGLTRMTFEKDSSGNVKGLMYQDDRHEEHWQKTK